MGELISIKEIETKNIMTKSSLPTGEYSANPYIGCPHKCKYCYESFMKKFYDMGIRTAWFISTISSKNNQCSCYY